MLATQEAAMEDCGSRPAWAKCLKDPILTNGWAWLCAPVIPAMQEA
jgi:hypothetical protein